MKRDLELQRKILLSVEEANGTVDIREPVQCYNAKLLEDSGLIEAKIHKCSRTGDYDLAIIIGLTSAGHDFLDHVRSDTVWKRFSNSAAGLGSAALTELVRRIAKEGLGLSE